MSDATVARRAASGLLGGACAVGAGGLAALHPVAPAWATAAAVLLALAQWRWPALWIAVVPALLPVAGFGPWTGWVVVEEFDVVVLALFAAAYLRLAAAPAQESDAAGALEGGWAWPAVAFGVLTAVALGRGVADAGGWRFDVHAAYLDAMNALRVGKPTLYVVLSLPLLRAQVRRDAGVVMQHLRAGMLAGAAAVSLAAAWERAAYPGLFDPSEPYRVVALFWEMHVGGAAIDAYLAMAAPFVAWAAWSARSPLAWAASAVLALGFAHACLVTFSRATYLGVLGGLAVLGLLKLLGRLRTMEPRRRWRRFAGIALGMALMVESLAVLAPGSFMWLRMGQTVRDYDSRLAHWSRGLGLLQAPDDWLLGIGLGRLPARYSALGPEGEMPGDARWVASDESEAGAVRLRGPATRRELGGLYELTQRVSLQSGYRLSFWVRSDRRVHLIASVCERHLLYEQRCQGAHVHVGATGPSGRRLAFALSGPSLVDPKPRPGRSGVFALTVVDPGADVALDDVELRSAGGESLLTNGNFNAGMARWFPSAQQYFVPWHIDNLALELLIERGAAALVAAAAVVTVALATLVKGAWRLPAFPFLAASICGALLVGLFASIADMPRAWFLLQWMVLLSLVVASHERRIHEPLGPKN